jgi:16S rRNA C967 or C1407 C5-methylase (RsmB/RsmF family)/NOL1/NOP2/fmu family ribosome biogenesis protein
MKALPTELLASLKGLPGFNESDFIESHREGHRITSLRLNPNKIVELDFPLGERVKWTGSGFYLNERPSFTHDPLFHAGCYYVQEAGSMFLEHALATTVNFQKELRILDLCAAPGGKSCLINSMMNKESLLVANEIIKGRADVLAYNLSKWGTCNAVVTNNDSQKFSNMSEYFDVIVVDAPCSGSGLFRKQPDAIEEWSVQNVHMCSVRQKKILDDVLPSLKGGGILVYSTCSYSIEENENITDFLIRQGLDYISIDIKAEWGIIDTGKGYRFYPHRTGSEGFFCAVFRNNQDALGYKLGKMPESELTKDEKGIVSEFLSNNNHFYYRNAEKIHFMNEAAVRFVNQNNGLYYKKAGTLLGEIKGKDLVPHHELALSVFCNKTKMNCTREEALLFLRKQVLSMEQKKGFSLISYKNQGIGWAKILPNRVNNYFPNEYRILN